jgi:hypothetical protein
MTAARRRSKKQQMAAQAAELAVAVPQVVAHRMLRMALAGGTPSARDRREFGLMGAEKMAAFQESWTAMWLEALRAQQQFSLSLLQPLWFPWAVAWPSRRAAAAGGAGRAGEGRGAGAPPRGGQRQAAGADPALTCAGRLPAAG